MRTLFVAALMGTVAAAVVFSGAVSQESAKNIIAAQIRRQGYQCRAPQSAEREPAASKPDEAVWLLRCDGRNFSCAARPKPRRQGGARGLSSLR